MSSLTVPTCSMLLACAALLSQLGCHGKTPSEAGRGLAQADTHEEGPNPRQRVRIPVVVSLDEKRQQIASASIETSPGSPRGVELALDDSALGIPLIDQLRHRCAAGEPRCVVWMEGYWGALIESDDNGKQNASARPFAVLRILQHAPTDAANALQDAE